ncbi:MAG: hypothetical protein IJS68_00295 [Clostridia bacterium]|nr:hypothetical protein [Clostridia bacterium]
MNTMVYVMLAIAVVMATVFVVLSKGQRGLLSLSLKSIASFCFTVLALTICYYKGLGRFGLFISIGLVASCFGDVILGLPDMPEMKKKATVLTLIGGLAFALAHVFYLSAMIMRFGFEWWVILVAIALGFVFFFGNKFIGKLNYGKLGAGMPVYATFVSLVVAESIMAFVSGANTYGAIMILIGFIMFWISDIVLMNIYFGGHNDKANQKLYYYNLASYYLGQILIASSLIFLI